MEGKIRKEKIKRKIGIGPSCHHHSREMEEKISKNKKRIR